MRADRHDEHNRRFSKNFAKAPKMRLHIQICSDKKEHKTLYSYVKNLDTKNIRFIKLNYHNEKNVQPPPPKKWWHQHHRLETKSQGVSLQVQLLVVPDSDFDYLTTPFSLPAV
jgi:hypothetical protein